MFTVHNRRTARQALSHARQIFTKLSLQSRFLIIMGTASIIIILQVWLMFNRFTDQLIERIGARFTEKQILYDKARTIRPLMREMDTARKFANTPLIKKWLAHEHDPVLFQNSMTELRNQFQSHNFFVAVAKTGNYYYQDSAIPGDGQPLRYVLNPTTPDDAWILDFIKRGKNHGVNVTANKQLGLNKIWIMESIKEGDTVIGVLGTGIDLNEFTRNTSVVQLPGVTNMFVDHNASVQIYNDFDHLDFPGIIGLSEAEHVNLQILGATAGNHWVAETIKKLDEGSTDLETEFVMINGKRYLAGIVALPEVGWYDLTLLDLTVLMPQTELTKIVLVFIAGALWLLAIMAFYLHRLVLKPVTKLTDRVSRIRQGDYSSIEPTSSGEVGNLEAEFTYMAQTIYKTQHWLEDEIEKRTLQLKEAHQLLELSLRHEREVRETQANLMALMAHEMRSPVAVISNTSQMLMLLAKNEKPDWQPRVEKILRSVNQLALLMDNFLTDKWLSMEQQGLNREMGDLNQLCADISYDFFGSHARHISFEANPIGAKLCADLQLVEIAVFNLLDNASKYSAPADEIFLTVCSGTESMHCIEVRDRGMGISADLQQHIFDKFARGRHETDIHGSGLGLYLVNWIARFHGGYTEVVSTPGQGSTFRLFLPKCSTAPVLHLSN
jgi:signal transduction histidine kinase